MSDLKNTARVYGNINVLLSTGVFAGNQAAALAEAQQYVAAMATRLTRDVENAEEAEKRDSVRDETNSGRVADSPVRTQGRKSRKGKDV